ncbi:MAG: hypothetical protein PHX83_12395 [Acidobacteriia bacterium]|nr:hypothetical protein [Terriglobia bacterium]
MTTKHRPSGDLECILECAFVECGGNPIPACGRSDAALDSRNEKRAAGNGMTEVKELRAAIQSAPTRRGALHDG